LEKKSTEVWKEYKKSRQNAKRVISLAKGKKQGKPHGYWNSVDIGFM